VRRKRQKQTPEKMVVVTMKLPESLALAMDHAVAHLDTDRSKFGRNAIREKLATITR
jgi:metal-responsive CopG/Arc/MetJ family transcriptional regulator